MCAWNYNITGLKMAALLGGGQKQKAVIEFLFAVEETPVNILKRLQRDC